MKPQHQTHTREDNDFTFKEVIAGLRILVASWPLILIGSIVGMSIAFVVNRYSQDQFVIKAIIAIEEKENPLSSGDGMLDMSLGLSGGSLIESRLAILNSYSHNIKVAQKFNPGVVYYREGRLKKQEIYDPKTFLVEFDRTHQQLLGVSFELSLFEDRFSIDRTEASNAALYDFEKGEYIPLDDFKISTLESDLTINYGQWIESPFYKFKVVKGSDFEHYFDSQSQATYSFQFNAHQEVASWAMKNLALTSDTKKKSKLIELSLSGPLPYKSADYLNASIETLQSYELSQKNLFAKNTITFIDQQISTLSQGLRESEGALKDFRADNLIVNLSSEANQMLEKVLLLEEEKNSLELQQAMLSHIITFLEA